jgi:hypothetical protein
MAKKRREIVASRIDYIDPFDCGSTVGYVVRRGRKLSAEVFLTDCNRKIEWYFYDKTEGLRKIDKAIEILADFRNEFYKAKIGRRNAKS